MSQNELLKLAREEKERYNTQKSYPNLYLTSVRFFLGGSLKEAQECFELAIKYNPPFFHGAETRLKELQKLNEYEQIVEKILNSKLAEELKTKIGNEETLQKLSPKKLNKLEETVRKSVKEELANTAPKEIMEYLLSNIRPLIKAILIAKK